MYNSNQIVWNKRSKQPIVWRGDMELRSTTHFVVTSTAPTSFLKKHVLHFGITADWYSVWGANGTIEEALELLAKKWIQPANECKCNSIELCNHQIEESWAIESRLENDGDPNL